MSFLQCSLSTISNMITNTACENSSCWLNEFSKISKKVSTSCVYSPELQKKFLECMQTKKIKNSIFETEPKEFLKLFNLKGKHNPFERSNVKVGIISAVDTCRRKVGFSDQSPPSIMPLVYIAGTLAIVWGVIQIAKRYSSSAQKEKTN